MILLKKSNGLFGFITALEEEIIWTKQQLYQVSDILIFAILIVNKYRKYMQSCVNPRFELRLMQSPKKIMQQAQ